MSMGGNNAQNIHNSCGFKILAVIVGLSLVKIYLISKIPDNFQLENDDGRQLSENEEDPSPGNVEAFNSEIELRR